MNSSGRRRRDVLLAVSGSCITLAGCTESAPVRSGYGTAYGHGYGTD
ncbi:hypothetical protein [Natronorubrum halophilum]|nr:hypothetical protein [Natronorubrum halophilum]